MNTNPDGKPYLHNAEQHEAHKAALSRPQPTADGYYWTRPAPDCLWRVVEISIVEGRAYIEEMGEEGSDILPACPWWEWVGPITPPPF